MKNRNIDYWNKFYKKASVQKQSKFIQSFSMEAIREPCETGIF